MDSRYREVMSTPSALGLRGLHITWTVSEPQHRIEAPAVPASSLNCPPKGRQLQAGWSVCLPLPLSRPPPAHPIRRRGGSGFGFWAWGFAPAPVALPRLRVGRGEGKATGSGLDSPVFWRKRGSSPGRRKPDPTDLRGLWEKKRL